MTYLRHRLVIGAAAVLAPMIVLPGTVSAGGDSANATQSGGNALVVNPGGGMATDGTDGLVLVVNGISGLGNGQTWDDGEGPSDLEVSNSGADQIFFGGRPQWCCSTGPGPGLVVGGTLYGTSGGGYPTADGQPDQFWTRVSVLSKSGSSIEMPNGDDADWTSTAKSSGGGTVRYEVDIEGLTYRVDRAITYTYPKNYYDEVWTFTIPSGNNATVKFYLGGDTAPGGADSGTAEKRTVNGLDHYYIKEPNSNFYVAYKETSANSKFDGAWFAEYQEPHEQMALGQDLGFNVDDTTNPPDENGYIEGYDVGQYIQWNLGSTPGTFTRQMQTEVGFVSALLPATGGNLTLAYTALALGMMGAVAMAGARRRATV